MMDDEDDEGWPFVSGKTRQQHKHESCNKNLKEPVKTTFVKVFLHRLSAALFQGTHHIPPQKKHTQEVAGLIKGLSNHHDLFLMIPQ